MKDSNNKEFNDLGMKAYLDSVKSRQANIDKFKFYYDLLIDIEKQLSEAKIRQTVINGAADGDLWLGKYASLRNEAFCKENNLYVYPPNYRGWNSLKQKKPFSWIEIFRIRYALVYKYKKFSPILLSLVILIISILIYFILLKY